MSLTLMAAVAAAVAASAGYLATRPKKPEQGDTGHRAPGDRAEERRFEGLPLSLGDVVLAGDEERWLTGAVVARENDELVAVVFLSTEGATRGAVAVLPPPRFDIDWLSSVDVTSPDEPPATMEFGCVSMRRQARRPVALEPLGEGVPAVGDAGLLALYEGSGGDVAVVICSEGRAYAWAGKRLRPEEYERLGAGGLDAPAKKPQRRAT